MDDLFAHLRSAAVKQDVQPLISCNAFTAPYGLTLSVPDAQNLLVLREDALSAQGRVEFGCGILPDLIRAFASSAYINQEQYAETLAQLQEIFYLYKNEAQDQLTDSELIAFMRQQFDAICFGDLPYLATTCLERFAKAVRAGYQSLAQHGLRDEYALDRDTTNEYLRFDEETRWEYALYKIKLEDLF